MKYRFLRKSRLTNSLQFRLVFDASCKLQTTGCALFFRSNELSYTRLGIIASKKHIKKAASRNTVKRVTREFFRNRQNDISCIDIVILFYKESNDISKQQIAKKLEFLWQKLIMRLKKA